MGDVPFLDQSEGKYWRAIEQGTRRFVGQTMRGYWAGGATGPYYGFDNTRSQDRFIPRGRADALKVLQRQKRRSAEASNAVKGRIQKPIMPHNYFRTAWREFNVPQQSERALTDALREVGIIR